MSYMLDINIVNKDTNAYFLCHGGLGDLFINSGAIRFLSFFYNKIYLFCPSSCLKNMKILFSDINVEFISYEKWYEKYNTDNQWPKVSEDWYRKAFTILSAVSNSFDWQYYVNRYPDLSFITTQDAAWQHWIHCGKPEGRSCYDDFDLFDWQSYINRYPDLSFITTQDAAWQHWIHCGKPEGRQTFYTKDIHADVFITGQVFTQPHINNYVTPETLSKHNHFTPSNKITNINLIHYCNNNLGKTNFSIYYSNIDGFYKNINLDLSIYYNYFHVHSTSVSKKYYEQINTYNYKIVFLHFISSCGLSYIPDNEWPHIYGEEYLIINPDKNHYDPNLSPVKYELANKYLNLLVVDYIDILLNATDIYVCDSCFCNMVYPLRINQKLEAENVIIYDRFYPHSSHAIPEPIKLPKN